MCVWPTGIPGNRRSGSRRGRRSGEIETCTPVPPASSPPHTKIQDASRTRRLERRRLRAPEAQDKTQFSSSDETIEFDGDVGLCDVRSRHQLPVSSRRCCLVKHLRGLARACIHACIHEFLADGIAGYLFHVGSTAHRDQDECPRMVHAKTPLAHPNKIPPTDTCTADGRIVTSTAKMTR